MSNPDTSRLEVFLSAVEPDLAASAEAYLRSLTGREMDVTHVPYDQFATIGDIASEANADLIVLAVQAGDHGQIDLETAFARFSLDSDIPVMLLRRLEGTEEAFETSKRIVVPLDGSSTAGQVLPLVSRMALITGLPVRFVMVIDPSRVLPAAYAYDPDAWPVISNLRETAHWALRQAESRMRADGVEVESELLFGPVNACLRDACDEGDVLVMTTHGSGRSMRRRVGSVARRMLASMPHPIVIMRASLQGDVVVDGYEACSWVEPLSHRPRV